jgi:hypothetical protein
MAKKIKKSKYYIVTIDFVPTEIKVKANGKVDAKNKAIKKLNKKHIKAVIDKRSDRTYAEVDYRYRFA